jgi:ech hydrogenase subunit B
MNPFISAGLFILFAPVIGILIAGIDRVITARMQGRVGPSIFQPWFDIRKLFEKKQVAVWGAQNFFIFCYLIFMIFAGALFYAGGDLLLVIFAFTLAHVFMILGCYVSFSPYTHIGAERELIQLMAIEPMIIITAIGLYQVSGSFLVGDILNKSGLPILLLPGVLIGFVFILTFKLRKSPFDLASSHHAHQELVKGSTTEFSGYTLGMIELSHLYELIVMLGFIWLIFGNNPVICIIAIIVILFLEILVDNCTSRVRWQDALTSAWFVTLVLGAGNIFVLSLM